MKKCKPLLSVALAFLMLLLCSCGSCGDRKKTDMSLTDKLRTVIAEDGNAPSGSFYSWNAGEGDSEYADIRLLNALFGDGEAIAGENKLCEEYALYLSKRNVPYEVAVFKLYSGKNCDYFAILCQRRIDALKREYSEAPEFLDYLNSSRVTVSGRYVIMTAVNHPKEMTKSLVKRMR